MKKIIFILFILFSFNTVNGSFDINSIKLNNSYIVDQAGIFSEAEENQLNLKIDEIEKATTAEILVATIKTTSGDDISKLGVDIGQNLGVGKPDKDNGLVILLAIDDREWNISTGYGLEGILPDLRTKRIGEKHFPDNFRNGDYYSGINNALIDINGFLISDENIISEYKSENESINALKNKVSFNMVLIFINFFIIVILPLFIYKRKESGKKRFNKFLILFVIFSAFSLPFFQLVFYLIGFILLVLITILFDAEHTGGSSGGGGWSSSSGSSSSSSSSYSSSSSRSYSGGSFGGGGSKGKW